MQFKSKLVAMRKTGRNAKDIGGNQKDDYADYYYDYYYDEEPLPSGPTRRPDTAGKGRKPLGFKNEIWPMIYPACAVQIN